MAYFKYLLITAICIVCFVSCGKEDTEFVLTNNNSVDALEEEIDENANYLNESSDYIFDDDKLLTFHLNLAETALRILDQDPAREEYEEGSLTFEGERVARVGIRYKGSIGAFVGCLSGNDWINPSGFKTCTKLSMKVKLNWLDKDDTFFGLKKLQFHSMNHDNSQMRERLGYLLFREMGVPAPRSVHAKLYVNGEYYGLYALTEQIDGRFTKFNYDDGSGNLYKEIWPLQSSGNPWPEDEYISKLKTNEDENPTAEMIRTFAQDVANASETDLKSVIEQWMDINEILSYIAVDRTIRNDDGAFHWYCNQNGCNPHNFFWYEDPTKNRMHLIPWDLDNAFENIVSNANPVTPIADGWGEITNNCQSFSSGALGARQKSAACDKLTAAWVSYENEYADKLEEFKSGPFSEARVNNLSLIHI